MDSVITFPEGANPFKILRSHLGLSQQRMADKIGISKHALLRNEQGMWEKPLPTVLDYFVHNSPVGAAELRNRYEQFQIAERTSNARVLGYIPGGYTQWLSAVNLEGMQSYPLAYHPLHFLMNRRGLNATSLSLKLCVNQSVLAYWLKNPHQQLTVPSQVLSALKDCGYDNLELNQLKEMYSDYRDMISKSGGLKLVSETA